MKRQAGNGREMVVEGGKKHETRKKMKRGHVVEGKEENGKKDEEGDNLGLQGLLGWEEWPWLRGGNVGVDEQMSWGMVWSPSWDVEFVDKAYGALFSDVAWDDDIWDLKTVMVIPANQ